MVDRGTGLGYCLKIIKSEKLTRQQKSQASIIERQQARPFSPVPIQYFRPTSRCRSITAPRRRRGPHSRSRIAKPCSRIQQHVSFFSLSIGSKWDSALSNKRIRSTFIPDYYSQSRSNSWQSKGLQSKGLKTTISLSELSRPFASQGDASRHEELRELDMEQVENRHTIAASKPGMKPRTQDRAGLSRCSVGGRRGYVWPSSFWTRLYPVAP